MAGKEEATDADADEMERVRAEMIAEAHEMWENVTVTAIIGASANLLREFRAIQDGTFRFSDEEVRDRIRHRDELLREQQEARERDRQRLIAADEERARVEQDRHRREEEGLARAPLDAESGFKNWLGVPFVPEALPGPVLRARRLEKKGHHKMAITVPHPRTISTRDTRKEMMADIRVHMPHLSDMHPTRHPFKHVLALELIFTDQPAVSMTKSAAKK